MRYTNAWMERGFFDERPVERARNAIVEIGWRTILVEWHECSRVFRYEGVRNGQGHFLLRSDDGAGNASLHRFQYSTVLEGFWKRNNRSGFWRVHLPEDTQSAQSRLPRAGISPATRRRKQARRVRLAA